MDSIRLNEWEKLAYKDAEWWLVELNKIEADIAHINVDSKIKSMRTNKLKRWNESRQAALLCFGMSKILGIKVSFAMDESSDYDFIARYLDGNTVNYVPIQLKELVPRNLNPDKSLAGLLLDLDQYADSSDLTIGIYINQALKLNLNDLKYKNKKLGDIWLFGSRSENSEEWFTYGPINSDNPRYFEYSYPTVLRARI